MKDYAGRNTTKAQISRDLDKFIWAAIGVVAMLVITIAFFGDIEMDTRTAVQQIEASKTVSGVYTALDNAGIPTGYNLRFTMQLARAENNLDCMGISKCAIDRIALIENSE